LKTGNPVSVLRFLLERDIIVLRALGDPSSVEAGKFAVTIIIRLCEYD
jgi:hypothetical protein